MSKFFTYEDRLSLQKQIRLQEEKDLWKRMHP